MNTGLTPSPLDAHLRAFTPAQAALTRLIGTPFYGDEAEPWQLRLAEHAAPMQAPMRLGIRSSLCAVDVVVEGAGHPALYAIAQDADTQRRTALAGLWLAPVLDTLSAAGLGDAALTAFAPEQGAVQASESPALPMWLNGPHGDTPCRITTLDWHTAPPAPPAADRNAVLAQLGAVVLPLGVRIASRRCATRTLATLGPGDVLLGWGQHAYRPDTDAGTVRLTCGNRRRPHLTVHAQYKEGTVTILDVPALADDDTIAANETTHDSTPANADGVAVQALEVPVHLELAVMSLPLAELAALAPGHVLQLPVLLRDATVRLVCHGQTLGQGQLVAVGEHLGLQISAMSARHAEH
jgi:type III secretion protein Q